MRSVQVSKPKGPLEIVGDIPEPNARQVRIKVQACGICHSDSLTKEGLFPGIQYPRVPGHEIAGVIDVVGNDVIEWKPGQRVAVEWHGGHCGGGAAISLHLATYKCPVLLMTVAMLTM